MDKILAVISKSIVNKHAKLLKYGQGIVKLVSGVTIPRIFGT